MPTISVIVPIYNSARYLGQAVESVLAQTYTDLELLLADDGSTDGSAEMARAYADRLGPRVRFLSHPGGRNKGVSATRNLAIREAAGQYMAFLDADDVWLPHKLEVQARLLECHWGVGMFYGMATCVGEDGKELIEPTGVYRFRGTWGAGIPGEPFSAYEGLLRHEVYAPVSTVVAPRDLLLQVGGFPLGLRYQVEDLVTWARITRRAPAFFLPEPLALYRVHSASFSGCLDPAAVVGVELEYLLQCARDAGEMSTLLADRTARLVRANLGLPGVPLRRRVARACGVAWQLRRHRALGGVLARFVSRRWKALAAPGRRAIV